MITFYYAFSGVTASFNFAPLFFFLEGQFQMSLFHKNNKHLEKINNGSSLSLLTLSTNTVISVLCKAVWKFYCEIISNFMILLTHLAVLLFLNFVFLVQFNSNVFRWCICKYKRPGLLHENLIRLKAQLAMCLYGLRNQKQYFMGNLILRHLMFQLVSLKYKIYP